MSVNNRSQRRSGRAAALRSRIGGRLAQLGRHVVGGSLVVVGGSGLAAAQASPIDEVGSAMCDTGLGDFVALVLAGIALFLVIKAGIRAAAAFDKMGSSRSDVQHEGKQQLVGAGQTLVGAFVPAIFGGILEAIGISTVSCIDFTVGIAMIVPLV